jgi:starch synthase (maltosyl-transferring)
MNAHDFLRYSEAPTGPGSSPVENGKVSTESGPWVLIEGVYPELNAGRYPIKRVPGERVVVEADVFAAGHDELSAILKYRHESGPEWHEILMSPLANDRWRAEFSVSELGSYLYTIAGWVDHFKTWRHDLRKRIAAGQDVSVDLLIGAKFVEEAAALAPHAEERELRDWARSFSEGVIATLDERAQAALDEEKALLVFNNADRSHASIYAPELRVTVDPVLARTGAWYEMFPRSSPGHRGAHGTFADVEGQLPRIAEMGFDVLYLPPIHPIGHTFRKGRNNNAEAQPDDPGSPWGIGSEQGGHTAIHPELGTIHDFKRLIARARELKLEIALDIAYQCSPDHPWVKEHPAWFRHRPDGTIQYAENPPKKYQDIYPIDFETEDREGLWEGLAGVVEYWVAQGVRVFRVDNPHTKTLPFWEWMIGRVRAANPEVIFLAEAFTRPRVMYALAKMGFNQSYNYFPWRNSKHELIEYLNEMARPHVVDFFRANLWPNTPDILPHPLQEGGRAAFMSRLILAATLGSSYGIYGPAFELQEHKTLRPGGEDYLNSEKYEIRDWNLGDPSSLSWLAAMLNSIRRENPALHDIRNLVFHHTESDMILAYSKATDDFSNVILVLVNLDWQYAQSSWVHLALDRLGLSPNTPYHAHDLLTGAEYQWHGDRNYVSLRPSDMPAHIFRVRRY